MKKHIQILALDLATISGFCSGAYGSNAKPVYGLHELPSKSKDLAEFFTLHRDWLVATIEKFNTTMVVFESPLGAAIGRHNLEHKTKTCGLAMQTEAVCLHLGITCFEVHNATVKKSFVGSGRAKKHDMILAANDRGFTVTDDNIADAIGIWLHAIIMLDQKNKTSFASNWDRGLFAA